MLQIKDCHIREMASVKRHTPLKEIIKSIKRTGLPSIPVLNNDGIPIGIINLDSLISVFQPQTSEINELLKAIPYLDYVSESYLQLDSLTPEMGILLVAEDILSKDFLQIKTTDPLQKAFSMFNIYKIKMLIVVDEEQHFAGVFFPFDLIYSLFKDKGVL